MHAAARRASLLDAGRAVFAERGYRAASLEEVAARAGVTKPVLYQHFSNKEQFFECIAGVEMDEIVKRLAPVITSGDPKALVQASARAWLRYAEERPDGFAAVASQAPIGWKASENRGTFRITLYDAIEKNVAAHLRETGLDERNAGVVCYAIVGMWFFVGQWMAYDKSMSAEETAEVMAALLWGGLEALQGFETRERPQSSRARRPASAGGKHEAC